MMSNDKEIQYIACALFLRLSLITIESEKNNNILYTYKNIYVL